MENRNEKRSIDNTAKKAMIDLLGNLNYFCFHGSGADDNCCGCPFKGEVPCPLAIFYDKLTEKLIVT